MSPAAPAVAMADAGSAVVVEGLSFRYGERLALNDVSFCVERGEIFGLLGPNGGGKTTLFRVLSTLATPAAGRATLLDHDLATQPDAVRASIGVVFQNPSVDPMLTVEENVLCHGKLYGMRGRALTERTRAVLEHLGLQDRIHDRCATLSGGLKRRVELAKGLLPQPSLLILDEPSTALDPGARRDLWSYLELLRSEGATVLVTTHLLEEAEHCDRIAILDRGVIVSIGRPDDLRKRIGGDVVTIHSDDPDALAALIAQRFGERPVRIADALRIEKPDGHRLLRELVEAFPDRIQGISVSKPTLEDVFVRETGHRFWSEPR
jgi:ABC-2 type transport system ATP-binding protein